MEGGKPVRNLSSYSVCLPLDKSYQEHLLPCYAYKFILSFGTEDDGGVYQQLGPLIGLSVG